ncbi:hypothetical protein DEO72_LG9g3554 [Vigna unguiculata]|uniref:Uncharacterized protein n=1 Tax=Vigna unguiculata TaxID=3917 RepID=A0A4D6N8Q7_VIGUN|nr:hypothetical protein DEO72_LG9g3554 [Vigna unguiculata]
MFTSADLNREAVVWDRAFKEVTLYLFDCSSILALPIMMSASEFQVKLNYMFNTARINNLAWSLDSTLVATGSLDTCEVYGVYFKPQNHKGCSFRWSIRINFYPS